MPSAASFRPSRGVVVPTRGRVKDIGRGVTHRTRIVELYL